MRPAVILGPWGEEMDRHLAAADLLGEVLRGLLDGKLTQVQIETTAFDGSKKRYVIHLSAGGDGAPGRLRAPFGPTGQDR